MAKEPSREFFRWCVIPHNARPCNARRDNDAADCTSVMCRTRAPIVRTVTFWRIFEMFRLPTFAVCGGSNFGCGPIPRSVVATLPQFGSSLCSARDSKRRRFAPTCEGKMRIKSYCAASVSALALVTMASVSTGAAAHEIFYPYHWGTTPHKPITPGVRIHRIPYVAPKSSASGTWTDVANSPFGGEGGSAPLVLTDGSVMIKQSFTGSAGVWYKLTPDSSGKYTDGTWTKLAAMPAGYSPDFFAEQVLTDGRVLIEGGEYNDECSNGCWTNKGALYDPVGNSWTSVSPPSGWGNIGDAQSIILPNGSYMLANCCDDPGKQAIASISGTSVTWTQGNSYNYNDEQGYTALPGGNVLMVDVWDHTGTYDDVEIYNTSTGTWSLVGQTADYLSTTSTYELGAAPLTPQYGTQGTVIQFTATKNPGVNDVYDVASNTWSHGPVTKVGSTVYFYADAPAATLPDGNIITEGSPGYGATPAHFWEFNDTNGTVSATQVNDTNTSASSSNFCGSLIPLPTGQVLWTDSQYGKEVAVYTPQG